MMVMFVSTVVMCSSSKLSVADHDKHTCLSWPHHLCRLLPVLRPRIVRQRHAHLHISSDDTFPHLVCFLNICIYALYSGEDAMLGR